MSAVRGSLNAVTSLFFASAAMVALDGIITASEKKLFVTQSPLQMVAVCGVLALISVLLLLSYRRDQAPKFGRSFSVIVCMFAVGMSLLGMVIPVVQAITQS